MRFLFAIAILFSGLAAQGKPAPTLAGEAAGDGAYGRLCELHYADLDSAIAKRRQAENAVYDKEARIRARHARFDEVGEADNVAFIREADAANAGRPTVIKQALYSENAVVKELNDKVVQDKDLVTALTNLRKQLEDFYISKDPELGPHVVVKYSDFKVHQLGLDTADPTVVKKVGAKLALIDQRLTNYLEDVAVKRGWSEKGHGLSQKTTTWFHSGYGRTPDEASLAARDSRLHVQNGKPRLRSFAETEKGLVQAARNVERFQGWVEKRFAGIDGMLVTEPAGGRKVLSAEAIEAVKKATPKVATAEGYRAAMIKALEKRFQGLRLSAKEADAVKFYLTEADRFSPPLLIEKRVVIDMGQPAAGVVSADFKGQNARNLEETLKAMARSTGADLPTRVKEVRKGDVAATAFLNQKKDRFQQVLQKIVPGLEAHFSGDDGMGFIAKPFTPAQKLAFAKEWTRAGGEAGDLRLTFENFKYADTGRVIPTEERSNLVVASESIEKKLRSDLLGTFNRAQLNGTQVMVSLEGAERGASQANVILLGHDLPAGAAAEVRELVQKMGFRMGELKLLAP